MSEQTERKIVKPWQAILMLILGIAVIIVGLRMGLNNRIILLFDGVLMCVLACLFGIKYDSLQADMKATISSMLVAILILIAVGVLVGTWMISGTVPVMIYYGMKVLTPGLFLPIVCIVCTLMSTMAGTSWGTLATVGVAFMGVAQGLGVPLPVTAGAICVGAFFGDKISPLSDSPVLVSSVTDVPLMEGIKHSLCSTGPAYLLSLVFFAVYGLRFSGGAVGGETYDAILSAVTSQFNLSPLLLLPPVVVIILIVLKKPTLPTFTAGIFVAAVLAAIFQGETVKTIATAMYSGFVSDTGVTVADSMLTRGGFTSMLGTIGLLIAAGVFGAPLRTAGVVDTLLVFVRKVAKNSRIMVTGVLLLHAVFFVITGAYYVSYPVVGPMVKDMFPEYGLDKKNLMRIMLDTGTGLAPLIPWATTG
ncbi:MAG: Na+/H+ antiporter NhaC, partial [Clostridia bacterium]|nr:Na+/H+ antiporter NhaC [Clostridia bacterium]